ncbi:MAG TPA: hypothetical protein VFI49_08935 [Rudaea sp.]|nr:hypothetical protein [Rudaea sp.]
MKRCLFSLSALALLGLANIARSDSPGPIQSPWQAYPPSCLAYPLPPPSGPTWSVAVELETNGPADHHESVNVVFWRTPCKGEKSALLGKVFRDPASVNEFPAPVFEGLRIGQGAVQDHPARIATEPNTVLSFVPLGVAVSDSLEFVFENDASASIDYSQAVNLTINAAESTRSVSIPAYDESQYPTADIPLQLSGYVTGNWFDPAHGGEGAQVEVGAASGSSRYIIFAWYTYTPSGAPFWLFGQGAFNAGDRSANVTVAYATGGGFAGGTNATNASWGTLTVDFPDCNSMHFTYQANGGLPAGVPQGSGSRIWTRLTSMNGLTCE